MSKLQTILTAEALVGRLAWRDHSPVGYTTAADWSAYNQFAERAAQLHDEAVDCIDTE